MEGPHRYVLWAPDRPGACDRGSRTRRRLALVVWPGRDDQTCATDRGVMCRRIEALALMDASGTASRTPRTPRRSRRSPSTSVGPGDRVEVCAASLTRTDFLRRSPAKTSESGAGTDPLGFSREDAYGPVQGPPVLRSVRDARFQEEKLDRITRLIRLPATSIRSSPR